MRAIIQKIDMMSLIIGCLVLLPSLASAHRSGCHRWHSCPSDRGTYICGDLGYCSQCPDNQYCAGGQPRSRESKQPQQPQPSTAVEQRQTLSQATIHMTQQRLKEFGYDPGPIDGRLSPQTTEALRRFQTESGLQATGELDHITARRLGIEIP